MRILKKAVAIVLVFLIINPFIMVKVSAEEGKEGNDDSFGEIVTNTGVVWSESEYDGWNLTWSVGDFYDMLDMIEKDGVTYSYVYDDVGNRISKSVDEITIEYTYDSAGNLISENDGNNIIEYQYSYDEVADRMLLTGFIYNGAFYDYEFDDTNSISGILYEGEEIVKYEYNYGVCERVLGLDITGNWVNKNDDMNFIGNINPYRYVRQYFDRETGWYWMGRYYSQEGNRFIDGISDEKAEELITVYGDTVEIYCKRYAIGVDLNGRVNRQRSTVSNEEYIARVLYCESSQYIPDQQAVAWCIKSRMNNSYGGKTTAIDTVRYNCEFAGALEYNDKNGNGVADENENIRADFYNVRSGSGWVSACLLAKKLNDGSNPTSDKPSGYINQQCFRYIPTMTSGISEDSAGILYFEGKEIKDVAVINFGSITSKSVMESQLIQSYTGIRNIFFDYK